MQNILHFNIVMLMFLYKRLSVSINQLIFLTRLRLLRRKRNWLINVLVTSKACSNLSSSIPNEYGSLPSVWLDFNDCKVMDYERLGSARKVSSGKQWANLKINKELSQIYFSFGNGHERVRLTGDSALTCFEAGNYLQSFTVSLNIRWISFNKLL